MRFVTILFETKEDCNGFWRGRNGEQGGRTNGQKTEESTREGDFGKGARHLSSSRLSNLKSIGFDMQALQPAFRKLCSSVTMAWAAPQSRGYLRSTPAGASSGEGEPVFIAKLDVEQYGIGPVALGANPKL
jgi:hypothetical protein